MEDLPNPPGNGRIPRLAARATAVALLASHGLLSWLTRSPGITTGQDDAYYLMLARGLRHLSFADAYLAEITTRPLYPPGYPAILAVWGALVGDRLDPLLLLNVAFSVATLLLVYLVVRRLWTDTVGLICLAALAFNPYLNDSAGNLMSEAPYTFFSVGALAVLVLRKPTRNWLIVAGAAAVVAGLTRGIGVTIIGAVGLHWLLQRRYLATAALSVASAATVGAWLVWMSFAPEQFAGRSYAADLTFVEADSPAATGRVRNPIAAAAVTVAGRVAVNVPDYLTSTVPYRMPFPTISATPVDNVVGIAITVLGALVGVALFLRRFRVGGLYLLLYGGLLAIWSWQIGRFVIPAIPLLVPAVLLGVGALVGRFRATWHLPAMAAVAAVLTINGAWRSIDQISALSACERGHAFPHPTCLTPDQQAFFEGVRYVIEHTPADAVFLSGKPITLYHYSGRHGVMLQQGLTRDPSDFLPTLRRARVDYILLSDLHNEEANRLAPLIEANCERVRLVREFPPTTVLFRVREAGATTEDGSASCSAVERYRQRAPSRVGKLASAP